MVTLINNNIPYTIYKIRNQYVMLDSDLAKFYNYKNGTKSINLAVKRNIRRFRPDYLFQLTKEEYYEILRFHNETLKLKQGKYRKYLPFVFTEKGIIMLSLILKTTIADQISVEIVNEFTAIQKKEKFKKFLLPSNKK